MEKAKLIRRKGHDTYAITGIIMIVVRIKGRFHVRNDSTTDGSKGVE